MSKTIGENIEALMGLRNMTSNQLAKKIGKTHKMIGDYIKGKSQPTAPVIIELCKAFRCDPNTLLKTDFNDNLLSLLSKIESLPESKNKMIVAILNEFISYHNLQTQLQGMIDPTHIHTTEN